VKFCDWSLGPREHVNQLTSHLDASMVYASTKEDALELRDLTPGESTTISTHIDVALDYYADNGQHCDKQVPMMSYLASVLRVVTANSKCVERLIGQSMMWRPLVGLCWLRKPIRPAFYRFQIQKYCKPAVAKFLTVNTGTDIPWY